MKLLLDANISYRLTTTFNSLFEDCKHVDYIELNPPASDIEILNYALKENFIIVTNDNDFLNFLNLKGFPPKIILLRTGNQSNKFIHNLMLEHYKDIENLSLSNEYGVLELYEPNIALT